MLIKLRRRRPRLPRLSSDSKTTRPFIKFLSPSRRKIALRRPAMPPRGIFFSDLSSSSTRKKRGESERETVGSAAGDEGRKKKTERVACLRAAGLMPLIMEKYIKRHPVYFLKSIPHRDLSPFVLVPRFQIVPLNVHGAALSPDPCPFPSSTLRAHR